MTGALEHPSASQALDQALEYLYSLRTFGVKPGLERTRALLDAMGAPDHTGHYLHIAGTNGKGSTAALLASILQTAGIRTGLFTSPHLVRFNERIRVNGIEIPSKDVLRILERIKDLIPTIVTDPSAEHPTFFEIVTVLAAAYFAEQNCEAIVWETGLGGRLDSTNAVKTAASIIASVSLDHCQWLGTTIKEVATEKAGIIHQGAPVFIQQQDPGVISVCRSRAREVGTKMHTVQWPDKKLAGVQGLPGTFQVKNAALAAAVARWYLSSMQKKSDIEQTIREGLKKTQWPARFQKIMEDPEVILDCAHNPGAFKILMGDLGQLLPGLDFILIMGAMTDKDISGMLQEIPKTCKEVWYIKPNNDRAANYQQFTEIIKSSGVKVPVQNIQSAVQILENLKECAGEGRRFVIAGSCYLAGEILAIMSGKHRDLRGFDPLRTAT